MPVRVPGLRLGGGRLGGAVGGGAGCRKHRRGRRERGMGPVRLGLMTGAPVKAVLSGISLVAGAVLLAACSAPQAAGPGWTAQPDPSAPAASGTASQADGAGAGATAAAPTGSAATS